MKYELGNITFSSPERTILYYKCIKTLPPQMGVLMPTGFALLMKVIMWKLSSTDETSTFFSFFFASSLQKQNRCDKRYTQWLFMSRKPSYEPILTIAEFYTDLPKSSAAGTNLNNITKVPWEALWWGETQRNRFWLFRLHLKSHVNLQETNCWLWPSEEFLLQSSFWSTGGSGYSKTFNSDGKTLRYA